MTCNHDCDQGRDCHCDDNDLDAMLTHVFVFVVFLVVVAVVGLVAGISYVRWIA